MNILEESHSIISSFDSELLESSEPAEKHTFILVIEDTQNKNHKEILKDFEEAILEELSKAED